MSAKVFFFPHPFTDERRETSIEPGTTLSALVKNERSNTPRGLSIRTRVNGELISADKRAQTIIKDNDEIIVRVVPTDAGSERKNASIWTSIGSIAVFGLALLAAIVIPGAGWVAVAGFAFASLGQVTAGLTSSGVIGTFKDEQTTTTHPSIRGASNGSNPNGKVPLILGKHLLTPGYLSPAYTEIAGTDGVEQYLRMAFILGYAPLEISNIQFGDMLIATNAANVKNGAITCDGVLPGCEVEIRQDASAGTGLTLYPKEVIEQDFSTALNRYHELDDEISGKTITIDASARTITRSAGDWTDSDNDVQVGDYIQFSNFVNAANNAEILVTGVSATVIYCATTSTLVNESMTGGDSPNVWAKVWPAIIQTTAKHTTKITVTITFPKLVKYAGDDKQNTSVWVHAYYRLKAAPGAAPAAWTRFETEFDAGSDQITRAKAETLRFDSETATLTAGQYEVMVARKTADETDSNIVNAVYWTALRSFTDMEIMPAATRKKVCILGVKVKSSEAVANCISKLNCLVAADYSYITTADPAHDWAAILASDPRNAALAFVHALMGPGNPRPRTAAQLDWTSIFALATWCDTLKGTGDNQYRVEVNGVITQSMKLSELLNQILAPARASLTMSEGKYGVVIDQAQSTPKQHIGPHNSWGFRGSKQFGETIHGYRVKFVNANEQYTTDERIVLDDGYKYDTEQDGVLRDCWGVDQSDDADIIEATLFETIEAAYDTNPAQVFGWCRYLLAVRRLRPEVFTVNMDAENLAVNRGELVKVSHPAPRWGLADGRITEITLDGSDSITGFTTDNTLTMELGKSYAVRFRTAAGTSIYRTVVLDPGEKHELTLNTAIPAGEDIPAVGDWFGFGLAGLETVDCIVAGVDLADDLSAKLTLFEAAPAVHTADTGVIPAFNSKVSFGPRASMPSATTPIYPPHPDVISYPATKALISLSDIVDFNGQYGIYQSHRYKGTMPNTWENDDSAPIYLTSLATPGQYDGQTGDYLGVRYVWSENALYPAEHLYPAKGLYPSMAGQWIMEDAAYAQSVALQDIATDLQAQLDQQIKIYVQNSDPRANAPAPWAGVGTDSSHTGDLWYDMTVGAQVTKRWSGTAWIVVEDAVLTAALARIASLESAADGTVTVYGERPEVGPYQVGDFWYDLTTPADPHLYVATVARLEGVTGSLGDWALTSISNAIWTSRITATNSGRLRVGDQLYENGIHYRCSFAGVRLYPAEHLYPAPGLYPSGYAWERISPISWGVLAAAPASGMIAFDTYFNSVDSIGYYYSGTAWVASTAPLATQDYADAIAADLQDQVDGKIAAFWQSTAPTSGMETDDLWFDTAHGNRAYRYNGASWADAQDSDIAAGILAAATAQATADGKTAVFSTIVLAQSGAQIGDLFLDASLLYRATVAGAAITLANSTRITAKIYPDVADASALAALTGMILGDTVYMTSTRQWYKYTTSWVVDGQPQLAPGDIPTYTPRYLGSLTALPGTYHASDYFLCKAAFSSFTKGLLYVYSGSAWSEDTDSGHKMVAMDDLFDIAENETDLAVVFAKKIVALEAVVRELFAQTATIQNLIVADVSSAEITAGDCKINVKSLSLTDDDLVSEAPQINWVVQAPGTIRVGCSLVARIGIRTFGYDSTITFYLYRTRSGTETLLGSYARGNWGGTNAGSFSDDISVQVGDIISLKVLQSNLIATASIGLDTYSPLALVV